MSLEAMKLALQTLEDIFGKNKVDVGAITSLRQAIEQAEKQEPVIGTKTWYEDGKVITQNLYPSDVYKQEKQEPVAYKITGKLGDICSFNGGTDVKKGDLVYNTPQPQDAEIKRLKEKIEFLARTNMLYSDWEHRETQVTSDLIRKGIEAAKENVELQAEIERLKKREWVGLTEEDKEAIYEEYVSSPQSFMEITEAKLKEKNT